MHEPDIAPLARRLAEENNVDWRRLQGSGEGGRVVERDVLGYLARVMAGAEAVDPTPEPVPEGMEAWPEVDVEAYAADRERAAETDSPPTLDDELFLFEDPAQVPSDTASVEVEATVTGATDDDGEPATVVGSEERDDDLWLVGDEPLPEAPAGAPVEGAPGSTIALGDEAAGGEVEADGPGDDETVAPQAADAGSTVTLPFEPMASPEAPAAVVQDDVRLDEVPDLTGPDVGDERAPEDAERGFAPGGSDSFELPELFAGEAEGGGPGDDATLDEEPLFQDEGVAREAGDDLPLEVADDPLEEGPSEVVATPGDEAPALELAAHEMAEPEAVTAATEGREAGDAELLAGAVWARYGQIWRRRIDDRTLRRSVSDLASVLDAPPSTVVALLLARAARRGGATTGAVEAWRWRRGGAERVVVDVDAPLREAVHRLETARGVGDGDGVPSLVVADLSAVDLDEAVLHLDAPVLALGRSSGDGAWLSLSGERVDAAMVGTLAQVAELLAAPVRLLV